MRPKRIKPDHVATSVFEALSCERHFAIDVGGHIIGLTLTGRATVRLLDMNGIPQLNLRQVLIAGGEFDS